MIVTIKFATKNGGITGKKGSSNPQPDEMPRFHCGKGNGRKGLGESIKKGEKI